VDSCRGLIAFSNAMFEALSARATSAFASSTEILLLCTRALVSVSIRLLKALERTTRVVGALRMFAIVILGSPFKRLS